MSNITKIDPEKIRQLERALARQRRSVRNLYILAAVMLGNTVVCAKTDNPKWMIVCSVAGLFDCYFADKWRRSYYQMRDVLDKYNQNSR